MNNELNKTISRKEEKFKNNKLRHFIKCYSQKIEVFNEIKKTKGLDEVNK